MIPRYRLYGYTICGPNHRQGKHSTPSQCEETNEIPSADHIPTNEGIIEIAIKCRLELKRPYISRLKGSDRSHYGAPTGLVGAVKPIEGPDEAEGTNPIAANESGTPCVGSMPDHAGFCVHIVCLCILPIALFKETLACCSVSRG